MASYSFTWNTLRYTDSDGVVSVAADLEGTAEGFGTVLGTITFRPAGYTSGTFDFVMVSYPETGDSVIARGSGEHSLDAPGRWSTSGTSTLSNGDNYKHEGNLDLANRSWSGTFG
jgi:hypothetical protein